MRLKFLGYKFDNFQNDLSFIEDKDLSLAYLKEESIFKTIGLVTCAPFYLYQNQLTILLDFLFEKQYHEKENISRAIVEEKFRHLIGEF